MWETVDPWEILTPGELLVKSLVFLLSESTLAWTCTYFCRNVNTATSDLLSLPAKAGFILFLRISSWITLIVTSGVRVRTRICKNNHRLLHLCSLFFLNSHCCVINLTVRCTSETKQMTTDTYPKRIKSATWHFTSTSYCLYLFYLSLAFKEHLVH